MFKKLYLSCILSLVSLPALGMGIPDFYTTNLTTQLNHVNSQINTAKRAWNASRLRIAIAQKAAPYLYATIKQIFQNIIGSDAFITNMNNTVDQQFESIVNSNMYFNAVKKENSLSEFSNKEMTAFAQQLYTAMANKAYYFLLGQKLSQKSKELAMMIRATQQIAPAAPTQEEAFSGFSF